MKKAQTEKLKEFHTRLRAYVHENREGCDFNDCPRSCEPPHALGLATAIAWEASHTLDEYLAKTEAHVVTYKRLISLTYIIGLHPSNYSDLYDLLSVLRNAFYFVLNPPETPAEDMDGVNE